MKLGYNTNGLGCHRPDDALRLLAATGYRSVALTVDHNWLDPYADSFPEQLLHIGELLAELQFGCVIETGARFLLDPRVKHEPTLISPGVEGRARRVDFLCRCIDIAASLDADAVSFWAGVLHEDISYAAARQRLVEGCREVADYADTRSVRLAFEPEPGMLIETFDQFAELAEKVNAPHFGLTVDIGHVQCVEPRPIADYLRQWSAQIYNIHIEDMCRGVHEHLRFGEGEIDFPPVLRALYEFGYSGGLHVELSRHSHMAPQVVGESYEFLNGLLATIDESRAD